jgi:hypothetical protein
MIHWDNFLNNSPYDPLRDEPCCLCKHTPRSRDQVGVAVPLFTRNRPKGVVCGSCYRYAKDAVLKIV